MISPPDLALRGEREIIFQESGVWTLLLDSALCKRQGKNCSWSSTLWHQSHKVVVHL